MDDLQSTINNIERAVDSIELTEVSGKCTVKSGRISHFDMSPISGRLRSRTRYGNCYLCNLAHVISVLRGSVSCLLLAISSIKQWSVVFQQPDGKQARNDMKVVRSSLPAGKAGEVETYWHLEISGKTNCVRLLSR